jgi:TolB-like protein
MVESSKAIFLSYAKQDAEAAARICAALRAAGLEVWFDQSELRGGDAWDAAIRKHIKGCALFVPIISAHTQSRAEGYFRLEWKLAIDRSHLMSHDRTFLLPVVIDDTAEMDERIPERFREVQWTRLLAGATSPAFIERVSKLLGDVQPSDHAPASRHEALAPLAPAPPAVAAPSSAKRARPRAVWAGIAAIAVLAVGVGVWAARASWLHPAAVVPYSTEDRRMTFAVLPFQAPLDDAHATQIAKATGEEIVTLLEARKELIQVAPTGSVAQALTRETGSRQLAKALDVHFLIRGTVARAGPRYTVTVITVDGDSERILETQSLSVAADALTPRWRDDVDDALYHLVRVALEIEVKRARDKPLDALDVRDLTFRAIVDWRYEHLKTGKEAYVKATDLLKRALVLAPDDPYALESTATVNLCDCVNAWSTNPEEQKAIGAEAMEKYLRIDPDSLFMLSTKADLYQLRGRYEEALVITDAMLQHDPESSDALSTKAAVLLRLGQVKQAQEMLEPLLVRYPAKWPELTGLAANVRYAAGDYDSAARLAQSAAARMTEGALRNPVEGPVRLTQIAAEARLGHLPRAKLAFADFTALMPQVTTITAMKKWVHPSADLANFEPLYDGLRLAGVPD